MVEEKGLDRAVADKIGDYVRLKGEFISLVSGCALAHVGGMKAMRNFWNGWRRTRASTATNPQALGWLTCVCSSNTSTSTRLRST